MAVAVSQALPNQLYLVNSTSTAAFANTPAWTTLMMMMLFRLFRGRSVSMGRREADFAGHQAEKRDPHNAQDIPLAQITSDGQCVAEQDIPEMTCGSNVTIWVDHRPEALLATTAVIRQARSLQCSDVDFPIRHIIVGDGHNSFTPYNIDYQYLTALQMPVSSKTSPSSVKQNNDESIVVAGPQGPISDPPLKDFQLGAVPLSWPRARFFFREDPFRRRRSAAQALLQQMVSHGMARVWRLENPIIIALRPVVEFGAVFAEASRSNSTRAPDYAMARTALPTDGFEAFGSGHYHDISLITMAKQAVKFFATGRVVMYDGGGQFPGLMSEYFGQHIVNPTATDIALLKRSLEQTFVTLPCQVIIVDRDTILLNGASGKKFGRSRALMLQHNLLREIHLFSGRYQAAVFKAIAKLPGLAGELLKYINDFQNGAGVGGIHNGLTEALLNNTLSLLGTDQREDLRSQGEALDNCAVFNYAASLEQWQDVPNKHDPHWYYNDERVITDWLPGMQDGIASTRPCYFKPASKPARRCRSRPIREAEAPLYSGKKADTDTESGPTGPASYPRTCQMILRYWYHLSSSPSSRAVSTPQRLATATAQTYPERCGSQSRLAVAPAATGLSNGQRRQAQARSGTRTGSYLMAYRMVLGPGDSSSALRTFWTGSTCYGPS
ncbi:MAG: hypothetical protein M1838_005070 [Thelocarpon superellum]|nr:MAG: hypothetical protein M1838_005070 [Thelocarpon superellum]